MKQRGVGERRTARRFWSMAEKRRIVAETLVPGTSVSVVARRHDVNANQLFKWRRELAAGKPIAALPVAVCEFVPIGVFAEVEDNMPTASHDDGRRPDATAMPVERSGVMEIVLVSGTRLRVDALVDERALCRVLRALQQSA